MAISFARPSAAVAQTAAASADTAYEKAVGYINQEVRMADGNWVRVARNGIPLMASAPVQSGLYEFLKTLTPEEATQWLSENVRASFYDAKANAGRTVVFAKAPA